MPFKGHDLISVTKNTLFRSACAIAEEDTRTVVITGGHSSPSHSTSIQTLRKAIRYGMDGWVENLEDMNRERKLHACTSYISSGERVNFN